MVRRKQTRERIRRARLHSSEETSSGDLRLRTTASEISMSIRTHSDLIGVLQYILQYAIAAANLYSLAETWNSS